MYIVIGASSFIGVYTVDEFIKQGCEVTVTGRNNKFREHYDRLGVPYINLDLTEKKDFDKLPKEGVDGVILLAGLLPANYRGRTERFHIHRRPRRLCFLQKCSKRRA